MGSRRLPGKVLLPLRGRTVIEEVLSRCWNIGGIDEVICAIPMGDERLRQVASRHSRVYSGSELDVLARYAAAAEWAGADIIMRITGDCPMIQPEICEFVLANLGDADYASNVEPRTVPQGLDCEVFTMDVLRRADREAGKDEREHVTTWMRRSSAVKRVSIHYCIDTAEDYERHKAFEHLSMGNEPKSRIIQFAPRAGGDKQHKPS